MQHRKINPSRRSTLWWSQYEGAFYAAMVACSETFALYYAVKRDLSPLEFAMISTLPILLGAIANWVVPILTSDRFLKRGILASIFIQILGCWGLCLSVGQGNPYYWILASLSLYWIGGMAASPLWLDWIAGWLPNDRMNRYLSRRNAFVAAITVISYLTTALFIFRTEATQIFYYVFAAGAICRMISWIFLWVQKNPPLKIKSISHKNPFNFDFLKSKQIVVIICAVSVFKMVASIGSPFFSPFMVNELNFNLLDYAWITAVPFMGRFLFLSSWGEAVRRHHPVVGLQVSMFLIAFVCFAWTFLSTPGSLTGIEIISGIGWGGFELSIMLLLYSAFPARSRDAIGAQQMLTNIAGLIGGLIGANLLNRGLQTLEVIEISAWARLSVAVIFVFICLRMPSTIKYKKVYGSFILNALSLRPSIQIIQDLVRQSPHIRKSKGGKRRPPA